MMLPQKNDENLFSKQNIVYRMSSASWYKSLGVQFPAHMQSARTMSAGIAVSSSTTDACSSITAMATNLERKIEDER